MYFYFIFHLIKSLVQKQFFKLLFETHRACVSQFQHYVLTKCVLVKEFICYENKMT